MELRAKEEPWGSAYAQLVELSAALYKTQAIIQDLDGTIRFWNVGSEKMYGWPREKALGRKSYELLQTELPRPFSEIMAEVQQSGSWDGEFRQRCRDGSIIWVASHWALHRNAQGEPVSVVKVNNDITALKRTGAALQLSEAKSRSLFENASQAILTSDRDGRILEANAMALRMFGYSHAELIGASIEMLLPPGLRNRHAELRAGYAVQPYARHAGIGMDLAAWRKDGSEFPVEISLSYLPEDHDGLSITAFISDITLRKQAEKEREGLISWLEEALSAKKVLIQEVHHRVKNNLAVIAGLLEMQASRSNDGPAVLALAESEQRVLSMAMVHEQLYASEHPDRVNFGEYLERLTDGIRGSVSHLLSISIFAEDTELPVNQAIPCGLIANELISNAVKYAYPRGQSGEINIRFVRLESSDLSLSCQDRGVGIPEEFDWQNSPSLGLRIVRILTKQLDGNLALHRDGGGTRFECRFPAATISGTLI